MTLEVYELQLAEAMRAHGLTPPKKIRMDGRLDRFDGDPNKRDRSSWYVAYGDGVPAGKFGDWRLGIEIAWRADIGRKLTDIEEMLHVQRMQEAKAIRDAELALVREAVHNTCDIIWADADLATIHHPYIERKGIAAHGAKITGDGRLILPLFSDDGELSSLQYIDQYGEKLYHSGGQTGGRYWWVGDPSSEGTLYIAEGFATAATISEATGRPCIIAYSASNLVPVSGIMREKFGITKDIVIVADNDKSGIGQRYAEQAAAKHGVRYVMPPCDGDANDYAQNGGDLIGLLMPTNDGWLISADDFASKPAPISWLVRSWIQEKSMIMVHGQSGSGKTFVVLDWCLHMASGLPEWNGQKVKPCEVVYLAGEGHHGLRGRIAAWRNVHGYMPLKMHVSRSGCDLNTPEGYSRIVDSIHGARISPSLIVVDTLHRFLLGDENSAQDAKVMLDACAGLMREFNCSILLVHHTGVSEEAQHRARGSSAWRGALDIEIGVLPPKDDMPMRLVQRKAKDSEQAQDIYLKLKEVTIPEWYDEDGLPVTSAIIERVDHGKKTTTDKHRETFERAWETSGKELRNDMPYVSKAAIKYMFSSAGVNERTIANMLSPSYTDRFIGNLLLTNSIKPFEHGWIVHDVAWGESMKNG